jgi:hypothetical protein
MNRSASDILNGGGHQLNRWPEEIESRWRCWRHVWFMVEIPEGLGRAWRRVLSLMPIGKLGFRRFFNSLLIYVISFSEIRIFVVGSFGWIFFFEILKRKDQIARESFNALILCKKPKSIDNGIYKREIERGREWRLGFFKWFGYVSLRPQDVANGLHFYYILFV